MTGRTHDLTAFTALITAITVFPPENLTISTAIVCIGANMIGGLAPDVDQTTSEFWRKIRFGRVLSSYVAPLFGRHRYLSHSIVGILLFGFLSRLFLNSISNILIVDMIAVWWSFMIGFLSHLLADLLTKDGIPIFMPLNLRFGFPPFKFLRITTGKYFEKAIIFPGLILLCCYIIYANYPIFVTLVKTLR